jgi:hypothetical protein
MASVAGRSQGRTRNRTILLVVVLGLVAWVGLALFADRVEEGAAVVTAPDVFGLPSTDPFSDNLQLPYDHNSEVVVTASLANRGRFAVTVTGVWMFPATPLEPDDLLYVLLRQEKVLVEGRGSSLAADRIIGEPTDLSLMSVTIPGGEERDISISARFDYCEQFAAGSSNGFEVLRVDYRHLGIPQTIDLPVRHVVVEAPDVCPTA